MAKIYGRHNFNKHTFCIFKGVSIETLTGLTADYQSKSGSKYYFTDDGVYRLSNHWGRAANCKWQLRTNETGNQRQQLGFSLWTAFHADNQDEKLYGIVVDFENKIAQFRHREYFDENEIPVLYTSSKAKAMLKQIRQLFGTHQWANYYDVEIDTLRKKVIGELLKGEKELRLIKLELPAKS